jgi:hypothetical protein
MLKKLIFLIFPFLENHTKNKKVRDKRDKFENHLSQIKNSSAILTDILEKKYSDTLFVKDKLEDKAKSNIVAITISITLILGASNLLDSIYLKFSYAGFYWISFILFILALIYMMIAGVLSTRVLINENTIYIISLEKYAQEEKILRQEYDTCTEANINQNLIRNNGVYASYGCIRNALICLFVIAVMVVFPYNSKHNTQSLSVNSNNSYSVVYLSDAVNHITQNNDKAIVEAMVVDAVKKGEISSSTPVGIINDTEKIFIKANIVNKTITIFLVEDFKSP